MLFYGYMTSDFTTLARTILYIHHPTNRIAHTTAFIISVVLVAETKNSSVGRKVGNVLFNDSLNTFYLRLYGIRHIVKDHSDSERENPLPPHRLLFSINSKGSFICNIPQTG